MICCQNKVLRTGLLIAAAQFFIFSGCKKGTTPCVNGGYSFTVTSQWSPQREIYNIGDTLNLVSTFPKTLQDRINTSLFIDYSNSVGISGNIIVYKLDSVLHQVIDAVPEFDYTVVSGTVQNSSQPARTKDIYYSELVSSYSFSLKVITKQKGIYAIFISNLYSSGIKGKDCTNAGFSNTLTNINKNITLFEYAMNRPPASQYEIDRIYCFRVQ